MNLSEILSHKYPGRQWRLDENDFQTLTFLDEGPIPTLEELQAYWPEVQALIQAELQAEEEAEKGKQLAGKMSAIFQKQPVQTRLAFGTAASQLMTYLYAGDVEAAQALLTGVEVPAELEAVKTELLAVLDD